MKLIVKLAGALAPALALAACGGDSDADNADVPADEVATAPNSAGTYSGTDPEGAEIVWTLDPAGTYEAQADGETMETGTWEDTIRGTCLTGEGSEGEQCYNFGEVGADGTLEVTGPDGASITMTKEG